MSFITLLRRPAFQLKSLRLVSISHRQVGTESSGGDSISDPKNDMPVAMENPYLKEKEHCILCKLKITPDYKNTKLLSQFVSPFTGRVYGRHITRLCTHKQELVEKEIIKAQSAGFMPYYNKEPFFLEDPKLFNPEKPIRHHDYC